MVQVVNQMSSSVLINVVFKKFGYAMLKMIVAIFLMKVIADLLHQVIANFTIFILEIKELN